MKFSKDPDNHIGFGTLTLWQSGAISRSINVLIMGYLMFYCTDTLKVPAAGVSLILMLSKFIDGFTDAVAGFIVDKTKTKWGTGRPYELFIIGLWLATWLMYSCPPQFATAAKYVWIFITYVLANAICMTFLNAAGTPYTVRAFKQGQIVRISSYGSVYTIVAAIIFNVTFPALMAKVTGSTSGWSRLALSFAVPMAAIGLLRMIFVKEKYDVDVTAAAKEKVKFKDVITILRTNKYIFILALAQLVFNFVTNMGVGTYYFQYVVKNLAMQGVLSMVTIVAIPVPFLFPKMMKKFSVAKLSQIGFFMAALAGLINFFAGANMPLLMIAALIGGIGTLPISMLQALLVIQCADYNEWKGHHRMEGTMSSVNSLATKVGAAFGTGILGIVLSALHFTGDVATTSASSIMGIRVMMGLVPMALYIVTGLCLQGFFKLDKLMPQIQKENKEKRDAVEAQRQQQ